MPYCISCGAPVDRNDTFCSSCGCPLYAAAPQPAQPLRPEPEQEPLAAQTLVREAPKPLIRSEDLIVEQPVQRPAPYRAPIPRLTCPHCGAADVTTQLFKEDVGAVSATKTRSKYREQRHGCLWWLLIGWWWWIVDLFLWIGLFPLRLLYELLRKRKYVGRSTTVSQSVNRIKYKTVCSCRACGNTWVQSEIESNPPPAGNRFMGLF